MGYEDLILRVAERLRTENEEQLSSQSDQVTDQGASMFGHCMIYGLPETCQDCCTGGIRVRDRGASARTFALSEVKSPNLER